MRTSGFMAPAEAVARAVVKAVRKDRAAGASTATQKIIEMRDAKADTAA
jgi:hypothetical protein